jgi:poly(3-hydroxybutyrate) depolymerase
LRFVWLTFFLLTSGAVTTGSEPTTQPSATVAKVPLVINGSETKAAYWLRIPVGYETYHKPALLIFLHGTDDTALDMLEFWGRLKTPYPVLMAAPQGVAPGWRSDDMPTILSMFSHLREKMSYDEDRVLLAGFSAGGAMTFHLLYKEAVPVTAAAALANYVPMSITDAEVAHRRHVPVFYAVGMADVNHERMRLGIRRLRNAGGDVTLYRPRIGHVLDPVVGQAALDWFFAQSGQAINKRITDATATKDLASTARWLEGIVAQARWHESAHVESARRKLNELEAAGRKQLAECKKLIDNGRKANAAEQLLDIENRYGLSRLGAEARGLRLELEADDEVRQVLAERKAERREAEAFEMYHKAQQLVAQAKLREAAEQCRQIVLFYGDTAIKRRAQFLLDTIEKRISP